jgi:hypothetical protein
MAVCEDRSASLGLSGRLAMPTWLLDGPGSIWQRATRST